MQTIKLSYSILSAWAGNQQEQAIANYLGAPYPRTPAMELGSKKHHLWAVYTKEHKKLHPDFGGEPIINPICEQKYEKIIPLTDDMQILLRGIPDLTCGERNERYIEYKCGGGRATSYVDSFQAPYMKVLVPSLEIVEYLCFNPYTGKVTKGIKYLGKEQVDSAIEHIITFGSEMIDYLIINKLLIDYKG